MNLISSYARVFKAAIYIIKCVARIMRLQLKNNRSKKFWPKVSTKNRQRTSNKKGEVEQVHSCLKKGNNNCSSVTCCNEESREHTTWKPFSWMCLSLWVAKKTCSILMTGFLARNVRVISTKECVWALQYIQLATVNERTSERAKERERERKKERQLTLVNDQEGIVPVGRPRGITHLGGR